MCEHDDLHAIVHHALGHAPIGGNHTAAKCLVFSLDCEGSATVPDPLRECGRRVLAQPRYEELEDLLILDGVSVRRIGDEDVVYGVKVHCVARANAGITMDWTRTQVLEQVRGREAKGPHTIGEERVESLIVELLRN